MDKKELTKKQLKKQLTTLTESKADIKSELKKAYQALKSLKSLLVGHKSGEATLSFSDLKKIKTAARHIEDIYEDMVDTEMSEKEKDKEVKVQKKNEQSEGHGKMYNALQGVREGKVVKVTEGTLKRIVERVIKEQKNVSFADMLSNLSTAVTRIKKVSTTAWEKSEPALTDKELADGKKKAVTELKSILISYTK